MAKQGKIPEYIKGYENKKDNDGNTVCYYLWDNGIYVPHEW